MLNAIRKIVIWTLGLPILFILVCFVTVATILTEIGMFFFKGISILAVLSTGLMVLVKAMPVTIELLPMLLLSIALFWVPELMSLPMAGAIVLQRAVWDLMIE